MRLLERFCQGVAAVSAAVLLIRAVIGPFWIVHNPLTAEIGFALSVLCVWLLRSQAQDIRGSAAKSGRWPLLLIPVAAAIAFSPILSMPLVTDDYIHLRQIVDGEAPTPLGCLTHSCGGPRFFRPLGFATYWAEWELWGLAAAPRHALDLLLHAISSLLFLLVVRRLGLGSPYDWLAGLIFAWNAIRPEAVAWPAARFDTLVVLFSLVAALCVLRGGRGGLVGSTLAVAAACTCKESAFVLPILLILLIGRKALGGTGRVFTIANSGVAATIFIWRWIVLKGVGGYHAHDATTADPLQFNPLVFAKTFGGRIWGILWFPLNWSRPLEWWLAIAVVAGLAGSLLLLRARMATARVALCAAAILVACLPTHHMLLIDASLERSRYLDLATPAFVLLLGLAAASLRRGGVAALGLLAVFHLAALTHNLGVWSSVSRQRYEFCRALAERAKREGAPVVVHGTPLARDGVYWRNGIEDCLYLNFDVPMGAVRVD